MISILRNGTLRTTLHSIAAFNFVRFNDHSVNSRIKEKQQRIKNYSDLNDIIKDYSKGKNSLNSQQLTDLITRLRGAIIKKSVQYDNIQLKQLMQLLQNQQNIFGYKQSIKFVNLASVMKSKNLIKLFQESLIDKCAQQIITNPKSNQLDFLTTFYIYSDLARLNKKVPEFSKIILNKLKQTHKLNNLKEIKMSQIFYFLKVLYLRDRFNKYQIQILQIFIRIIENTNILQYLSFDQKVYFFKILTSLSQNLKIILPSFMYKLKQQFQRNFQSITWQSLKNLIHAYINLSYKFKSFGDNLKSILINRLECSVIDQTGQELIFEILTDLSKWKQNRLNQQQQQKILEFLLNQFKNESFQRKPRLITLFQLLNQSLFKPKNIIKFLKRLNEIIVQLKIMSFQIQVSINYGLNVDKLILLLYKNIPEKYLNQEIVKLYHILLIHDYLSPQIQPILKQIQPAYNRYLQQDIFMVGYIQLRNILHIKYKDKIWNKLIPHFNKLNFIQLTPFKNSMLVKIMILSCTSLQNYKMWTLSFQDNKEYIKYNQINYIMSYEGISYHYYQLKMIYRLIELYVPEDSSHQIYNILFNKDLIKASLASDQNTESLFKLIDIMISKSSQALLLNAYTFNIILILQQLHCENVLYRALLLKISMKKFFQYPMRMFYPFIDILHDKDLINSQNLQNFLSIYEQNPKYFYELLISYVDKNKLPERHLSNFDLRDIKLILNHDPKIYEERFDEFIQCIQEINKDQWKIVLFALRQEYNHPIYEKFKQKIIEQYEKYRIKFNIFENLTIARKANSLKVKNIQFWDSIFQSIMRLSTKYDISLEILLLLYQSRFYNNSTNQCIQICLKSIKNHFTYYKKYADKIIYYLFHLNYKIYLEQIQYIKQLCQCITNDGISNYLKFCLVNDHLSEIQQLIPMILTKSQKHSHNLLDDDSSYYLKHKYPLLQPKFILGQNIPHPLTNIPTSKLFTQISPKVQKICIKKNIKFQSNVQYDQLVFDFKLNDIYIKLVDDHTYFDLNGTHLLGKGELLKKTLQLKPIKFIITHSSKFNQRPYILWDHLHHIVNKQ